MSPGAEKIWVSLSSVGPNAGIRAWTVFKSSLIPPSRVDVPSPSELAPLGLPRIISRGRWARQRALRSLASTSRVWHLGHVLHGFVRSVHFAYLRSSHNHMYTVFVTGAESNNCPEISVPVCGVSQPAACGRKQAILGRAR